ncbi:hypothetical protein HMPREF1977_1331 [Capnocytophaga ochracea F0287]|uniref:Uncharacterized protein n=1 Tax=Capnocytophaga ochracea F0287 TaxID=873517 RepID=E4MSF8_CAPOC|nr:hypothetical protein HMPREF1977_1331 [Capnocytophaga ochracea F0287]EJF43517.1 hypothetical protein HMPREF1319_1807 [Capnocytophaga ochracea str. Holt 25]
MLKRYYFYIDFERRKSKNNFLNRQIVFITFILIIQKDKRISK